jgi:flagellar hook-associated protein 3 FlgL
VAGSQFTLQGTPAAGDIFTIAPAKNQSLFQTVQQMSTLLSQGGSGGAPGAQFDQGMNNILSNFNQGLTRLLTGQAAVGSSLAQINAVSQTNSTQQTNDAITQNGLISANLPAVATAFEQGSTALQAALGAFSAIQGMNLFTTLKL